MPPLLGSTEKTAKPSSSAIAAETQSPTLLRKGTTVVSTSSLLFPASVLTPPSWLANESAILTDSEKSDTGETFYDIDVSPEPVGVNTPDSARNHIKSPHRRRQCHSKGKVPQNDCHWSCREERSRANSFPWLVDRQHQFIMGHRRGRGDIYR